VIGGADRLGPFIAKIDRRAQPTPHDEVNTAIIG